MNTKKKITVFLILLCLLPNKLLFAQVGIHTSNPQGVFHVDGARDNNISGVPTTTQQLNDFIVTSSGNVGIGTTAPGKKLEIVSPSSPALRIDDGTQQPNYVLMSDANGNGSWKPLTNTIVVNLPPTGFNGAVNSSGIWSGVSINLPPGRWIVFTNILLKADTSPTGGNGAWVRLSWSNTQNTYDIQNIIGGLNSGVFLAPKGLATGSTIINNTTTGNKTYFLNLINETFGGYSGNWDNLGSSSWTENSIIAYPAN